ncbi:MAG: efflux RND transporter permease subunit [Deltaproteobacteria bacterium]|nr:efflux RND transporter permease subunit [Deltaproteobacteria bacterium]
MPSHPLLRTLVEHPVGVLMVAVAAVVFGWVSFQRLPLDLMPDIAYPTLTVRTELPGAAPQEVETEVSRPLEEALATVHGLVEIESRSRAEVSDVVLEYDWDTDMDQAAQDVRERLQVTWLPDEAERPLVLRYDPSLEPMLTLALAWAPDAPARPQDPVAALLVLREIAEQEVKPVLEAMEGVAAARVRGGLEREVLVEVREDWLAARGVTLSDVREALVAHNVNIAGGSIREGDAEYLVRTLNQFSTVEEVRAVEITRPDGARVRVQDVATVREGHKDREVVSHVDGEEAVLLEIHREADANLVQVARSVRQRAGLDEKPKKKASKDLPSEVARALEGPPTLADALPEGLRLVALDDQASFVESALGSLWGNVILGGLLAIWILFLFLRNVRATLLISIAIPVSLVASFALLYILGVSLNVMTLGGLALGVGMLVDSAVVVLESIQVKLDQGLTRKEAAIQGTGDVAAAVAASILTTVAVFFPIVFVEGVAGQIFGDLAHGVTWSLAASMAVALGLVPVLAAREFAPPPPVDLEGLTPSLNFPSIAQYRSARRAATGRRRILRPWLAVRFALRFLADAAASALFLVAGFSGRWIVAGGQRVLGRGTGSLLRVAEAFGRRYDRFAVRYQGVLAAALERPGRVLGIAGLLVALAACVLPLTGVELIPQVNQGRFTVETALAVGTPLDRTVAVVAQLERDLLDLPGIAGVHATVGTERDADARSDEGEHTARLTVELTPGGDLSRREPAAMEAVRAILARTPELEGRLARPALFSFRTPVEVVVGGPDLDVLKRLSARTVEDLRALPGLADVRTSLTRGYPEIRIRYDRDQISRLGLSPATVAGMVRDKVQGADADTLSRGERRVDLVVRLDPADRASVEHLGRLNVNPQLVPPVPLVSVASLEEAEGLSEIRRIDQERAAVVSANLEGFDLSGMAREIGLVLADRDWPAGTSFRLAGQSREMERSLGSLRFALLLAVFLVYAIMASTFENLLHPFVILFSVPLATVGVLLVLAPLGISISTVVFIGIIVLVGVVVNNAIVLVDAVNRLRGEGRTRTEALLAAGRLRLRPILITTGTTVLGLTPLALGWGDGSELQRPMAVTVIAGLTSSTLLTLVVIPVLYDRLASRTRRTAAVGDGEP